MSYRGMKHFPRGRKIKIMGLKRTVRLGVPAAMLLAAAMAVPTAHAAGNGQNMCISIDGVIRVQKGTATCSTPNDGTKNRAVAIGDGASAIVVSGWEDNDVQVNGDHAEAHITGSANKVVVNGSDSSVKVLYGANNDIKMIGNGNFYEGLYGSSYSEVHIVGDRNNVDVGWRSSNNQTSIKGNDSRVSIGKANGNVLKVLGSNSSAVTGLGFGNNVTVRGNNSNAGAGYSFNATIAVRGDNSNAYFEHGDGNTLEVDGTGSSAKMMYADASSIHVRGDGLLCELIGTEEAKIVGQTVTCP